MFIPLPGRATDDVWRQVLAAAKRDAATLELERLQQSGQRFLPNPAGIKAVFFRRTKVGVSENG